jgi:RHS repeat-associated protein
MADSTDKNTAVAAADAPVRDLSSARLAAKLRGRQVEVLGARTETATTWANPDGTLTTETSAGPIRFRRGADWVDVDVTFAKRPDGSVASKAHPRGLTLSGPRGTKARSFAESAQAPAQELLKLSAGDKSVAMMWKGGLPDPKLDGAKATYVDAFPGADLVVDATRTGYEQSLVLKKRPAETATFTLPLHAPGVTARRQDDGSVSFVETASGRELSTMPAPVMWDANVDKKSGEHTRKAPVGLTVVQLGDDIELRLAPDTGFLADPATKFPVTVDPSDTTLSDVFDTWVQQGETIDASTSTDLKIGWPGDWVDTAHTKPRIARSYISWSMAPIKDAIVSQATLSLFNWHSWDCTKPTAWEVWDTNNANTATRWTNQPTWLQKFTTSTETKGQNCSNGGWVKADVTAMLQYWAGQTSIGTQGMGLRATDEANVNGWKKFYSGNAAASQIPKISVTYNYRPRPGTDQQAGPPFFAYNGAYVVNTLTPTLRDTYVDANNDRINGTFQIFDSATDTQVGNVLVSPWGSSGQPVEVVVPAGLLTNGKTYRFRTNPYDGLHYNLGWSAWKTFTVDTAAPSAPASVTSTDYPTAGWVKGIGQSGVFTATPPTDDHQWIEWTLDESTWTKIATNGSNTPVAFPVTPTTGGTNTLRVRTVDRADNKSESVAYTFHVGAGGIAGFDDGQRTAARLPLAAEADGAKFDAVTFSWRRSDADAWAPIPVGDIVNGNQPITAWPLPLTQGKSPALTWNATSTVNPDGVAQIKADFTGPNSATGSSDTLKATVDRAADGAALEKIGPGTVNLLTGDFAITSTDVSLFGMSVARNASSRTPNAGARQAGQVMIFGKEWASGTAAMTADSGYTGVVKTSDTSVDVVGRDASVIHFSANAANTGWVAEIGAEGLVLTGGFGGAFVLSDATGVVTTFQKADPAATTWTMTSSLIDGHVNSTTRVVSETVVGTDGGRLARPKRVIAATSAVTLAACEADPSTRGCRVLEYVYANATTGTASAFGDFTGQVRTIRLWATAPGASASTATDVAAYAYDNAGRLRQTWDPRISPALKIGYDYDADGRVTSATPAGQLPWTFAYGRVGGSAAAGDGMLLSVSRATLVPNTVDQINGTANLSVVYGVPVTGARAPYDLGTAAAASWGQSNTASDATAIFPADQTPTTGNGPDLTANSYGRAVVHYLDASGREVNNAQPGGFLSTTERNKFGNVVRELTAGNRVLALGTTDQDRTTLTSLGISALSSAERAQQLSTSSTYNDDGSRQLATEGPLHQVLLTGPLTSGTQTVAAAGSRITARSRTVNEFDAGRPTDGTATTRDQVTRQTTGAQPRGNTDLLADARVVLNDYDWAKGLPTSTTQDPGGLNLVKTTTYDAQGRVVKTTLPASDGNDAGATVTTFYTGDGTGPCSGRPEWADAVCTTGPAGQITGGGANPTQLVAKSAEYGIFGSPTTLVETANGVTRTSVVVYDAAGRVLSKTITGGLGAAVPVTSTTYDATTGQIGAVTATNAGSINRTYDRLGREISYTDADGGVTTTGFDTSNRPRVVVDTAPSTTTYTYDTTIDPRGLTTSVTDSVAGTFTARYDADGAPVAQTLPGGYSLRQRIDPAGTLTGRTYTRDGDGTVLLNDTANRNIHGDWIDHTASPGQASSQTYGYDAIGRLTKVTDTANGVCATRTYGFDRNSNRTTQSNAVSLPGADCSTTGGTTTTRSYDSADRLADPGYTFDAFGRSTGQPNGSTNTYYANDSARQQTAGDRRQTWSLDPAQRFRNWTVENNNGGTWSPSGVGVNHYSSDSDSPRWISSDANGAISRNVSAMDSGLAATTSATGDVVLQLVNLHGDITIALPLDAAQAPRVFDYDEYGTSRGADPGRYGWLGGYQRSSETPSRDILMGARLYQPGLGRFGQTDPVLYGNANAYDYVSQNPLTGLDLDGRRGNRNGASCGGGRLEKGCNIYLSEYRTAALQATLAWGASGAAVCAAAGAATFITIIGAAAGAVCGMIAAILGFSAGTLYMVDSWGGFRGVYFSIRFARMAWWAFGWHYSRWVPYAGWVWHQ